MQKKIMKKLSLLLDIEAFLSFFFHMTSDLTCLETYAKKNTKTMHLNETWINLIYMDF